MADRLTLEEIDALERTGQVDAATASGLRDNIMRGITDVPTIIAPDTGIVAFGEGPANQAPELAPQQQVQVESEGAPASSEQFGPFSTENIKALRNAVTSVIPGNEIQAKELPIELQPISVVNAEDIPAEKISPIAVTDVDMSPQDIDRLERAGYIDAQTANEYRQMGAQDITGNITAAIGEQESRGRYDVINKDAADSDQYGVGAIGKYQMLGHNVAAWAQEAASAGLISDEEASELMNDPRRVTQMPDAQDKIANMKLRQYHQEALAQGLEGPDAVRYAASKWYSGDGRLMNDDRRQGNYPSIQEYTYGILNKLPEGDLGLQALPQVGTSGPQSMSLSQLGGDVSTPEMQTPQQLEEARNVVEELGPQKEPLSTQEEFVPKKKEGLVPGEMDPFSGLNTAVELQKAAVVKGASEGAAAAVEDATYRQKMAAFLDREREMMERRAEERQKRTEDAYNTLNDTIKEFKGMKIDNERIMKNRSTGRAIADSIAIILGGIGAGMTGGPNQALQTIRDRINRDINQQKTEIAQKRGNIDLQSNLIGMMRTRFADEETADASSRFLMIDKIQQEMLASAAKFKSPQIMANAQAAVTQLETEKQQLMLQIRLKAGRLAPVKAMGDTLASRITTTIPKELHKDAYKELGHIKDIETSRNVIGEMYDNVRDIGVTSALTPFAETKAKVDASRAAILVNLQSGWKGAMSDRDVDRIKPLLPNPTDTAAQIDAKKKVMLQTLLANAKRTPILDTYGLTFGSIGKRR